MHTLSFEGHVHRRGAHSIPRDADVVDSVVARGPGREGRETRPERERGEREEKRRGGGEGGGERRVGEERGRESDGLTEEQGFAGGGEGRVPAAAMTAAGCKGVRMHS